NQKFLDELQIAQRNADTLKARLDRIKGSGNKNGTEEAEENLKKYLQKTNQEMESRKQGLTQKVLEEINDKIHSYGENHNYKMILLLLKKVTLMIINSFLPIDLRKF